MSIEDLPESASPHLQTVLSKLRKRQLNDSYEAALYTLLFFQNVFNACENYSLDQFLSLVSSIEHVLHRAHPSNLIPGNICGRLTHIIEEEREDRGSGDRNAGSSSSLTEAGLDGVEDIKYVLLDEIKTMMEEIKAQDMNYAQQALEQIHSNEVILVLGYSRSVFQFLRAARSRHITVYVCENAHILDGRKLVEQLHQVSIDATLITDAALFAIMPRVHRVLLGAQAATIDGGAIVVPGSVACSAVAAQYQVPVCICAGSYQFSHRKVTNPSEFEEYADPQSVWSIDSTDRSPRVLNLALEYLPPSSIDLFITHASAFSPSNVARFLAETGLASSE